MADRAGFGPLTVLCGRLAFVVLAAGVPSVAGAMRMTDVGPRGREGGPPPEARQGRHDAEERLLDYEMWRMTQELDLSDDEAARVFPRVRQLAEAQGTARRERGALMSRLRARVAAGDAQGAQRLAGQIRERDAAAAARTAALEENLLRALPPGRQAEYLLFRERFDAEVRRLLQEARRRRGIGPPGDELPPEAGPPPPRGRAR